MHILTPYYYIGFKLKINKIQFEDVRDESLKLQAPSAMKQTQLKGKIKL